MPNDRAEVRGSLPRKPQRWAVEWLVKTPDGLTYVEHQKTIQRATYLEVREIMAATIDAITAEIGTLASFVSWRATSHGGTRRRK